MRTIGQGYSGLEIFTSLMNLPKLVTVNNYDKIINRLVKTTKALADIIMQGRCEELWVDSSSDAIKDVEVSLDGTWQHRGYSSLNGVVTVISIKNGKALDIEPMSRACEACVLKEPFKKTDPLAFEEWKTSHVCKLNHSGSAGNMEPVGAKRIWERSLQKNKSWYTSFYDDSDSKSYAAIKNTYPGITVQKLECVGNAQKRVGFRLRNLKNKKKIFRGKESWPIIWLIGYKNYCGISSN